MTIETFKEKHFYKSKIYPDVLIYIIGQRFGTKYSNIYFNYQQFTIRENKLIENCECDNLIISSVKIHDYELFKDAWIYINWPEGPNPEQFGCCISNASDETPIMTTFDIMDIFASDIEVTRFFYLQMMHGVKEFKDVFEFCEKYGNKETLEIIDDTYKWAKENNIEGRMT